MLTKRSANTIRLVAIFIASIFISALASTAVFAVPGTFTVSGFVRAQAAYSLENENPNNKALDTTAVGDPAALGLSEDQDFNLLKAFLVTDLEYAKPTSNGSLRFFTRWRANVDMTQNLSGGVGDYDAFPLNFDNDFTLGRVDGDEAALELWEGFADIRAGRTFFRIGRQNIVWGETEGFRLLDVVNPLDLSQHLFIEAGEQFDHIRIPLWALRAQYEFQSLPGYSIDAFVIPGDYVPTGLPDRRAPFNLLPFETNPPDFVPLPFPPFPGFVPFSGIRIEDELDDRRGDWEGGVRLLGEIKGVQYTLNYISKIDQDGVTLFDHAEGPLSFDVAFPFGPVFLPSVSVLKTHRERLDIFGASFNWFSSAVAGVFSGEATFVPGQPYEAAPIAPTPLGASLIERDTTKFVLAFDRPTFIFPTKNAMGITFEWFQTRREGDESAIAINTAPADKNETNLVLLLRQPLRDGRFEVSFLAAADTDDAYWLQPQVKYSPGDHWRVAVYGNHFSGSEKRPGRLGGLEWAQEINLSVTYQY